MPPKKRQSNTQSSIPEGINLTKGGSWNLTCDCKNDNHFDENGWHNTPFTLGYYYNGAVECQLRSNEAEKAFVAFTIKRSDEPKFHVYQKDELSHQFRNNKDECVKMTRDTADNLMHFYRNCIGIGLAKRAKSEAD